MAAPGNRIGKKEKNEDFYKAILLLKDEEECYSFFRDVCTIAELRAMEQRFEVARMLTQGRSTVRFWSAPAPPARRSRAWPAR